MNFTTQVIEIVLRHAAGAAFPSDEARAACEAEIGLCLIGNVISRAAESALNEPGPLERMLRERTDVQRAREITVPILGMPVEVDPTMPPDVVEIRHTRERVVFSPTEPNGFAPAPDDGKL